MDRFSARNYPSVSKRIGLVRVTRLLASPGSFPFDAISLSLKSTFLGHLIYTDRITFFFFPPRTHNVIYSNDYSVYIYIYMQSSCNKLSSLFVQLIARSSRLAIFIYIIIFLDTTLSLNRILWSALFQLFDGMQSGRRFALSLQMFSQNAKAPVN